MKKCNECGELKDCEDFYSTNRIVCKACLKERTILWQKNHPQGLKVHQANRRAKPGYKKKQAEFYRQWYAKNGRQRARDYQDILNLWRRLNPEALKAYGKVRNALKKGEIIKPIHCSRCNEERKLLAHHDDYKLPLEVEWLCYSCHKKLKH